MNIMKIELRKIKHYKRQSEETLAHDCEVWVDGKFAGTNSNSGKGEGNYPRWNDPVFGRAVEDWVKGQPPIQTRYGPVTSSIDFLISQLVSDDLLRLDAQKLFKTRLCYRGPTGELLTTKTFPAEKVAAFLQQNAGRTAPDPKTGNVLLFSFEEVHALMRAEEGKV